MLFNPFAKVEVRMLVAIMVDFGKVMMDREGRPKGHHDKDQYGEWYRYPQSKLFSPYKVGHGHYFSFLNFQRGYHTIYTPRCQFIANHLK